VKKFILGAVAALLLVAPAADAKAFRGTVVKKGSHAVVVATATGSLKTVRTARHFGLGTKLRVNGHRITRLGHASRAKISGVVRGNKATRVVLSGNRTEIEVHPRRHHREGSDLLMTVRFSHGQLIETRSREDRHIDDAEIRGIASVDASGVHVDVAGTIVDITIPAGADMATIQAFNGTFVEVEFDVVNGVKVLRKITAEDNDQEAEAEGLDDLTGTLTINADGTTITVTPAGGAPITLTIHGVSLAGLATGDLVEAHFDVVTGPSGQALNLTRITSED
jgi:hypothetical protein